MLGVPRDADKAAIKNAFRELALKYHPDKNKGDKTAEDRFKDISAAYEVLSDSKKKAEYDTMRKYGAFAGAGGRFAGFANRAIGCDESDGDGDADGDADG